MSPHDPGEPPDELLPQIHRRLKFIIEQTDAYRTALGIQRRNPAHDANARMRLIELEQMGVWFPELIPERGRRACETALMASMMYLRRNNADTGAVMNSLTGIVIGARAVSEAYEAAAEHGVLVGLSKIESCFEESAGQLFVTDHDGLINACHELVAALRMQEGPPTHDDPRAEDQDSPPGSSGHSSR